jgi:transposase
MDPVTLRLGGVAAALIAKAVDKTGDKTADAGWAVVGRLVGKIRRHFREHGDGADRAALARVEDPPASAKHLETLAAAIDRHAGSDPELGAELRRLVEEAAKSNLDVGSIVQSAWGNHNIEIGGVSGSTITITGSPPPIR